MKKALFFICWILPFLANSQTQKIVVRGAEEQVRLDDNIHSIPVIDGYKTANEVYLKGAVPEENGRVVFRYSIPFFYQTTQDVFEKLKGWQGDFSEAKIAYVDSSKYEIALLVKEHLQFKQSTVYVDESDVSFNMLLKVFPDRCDIIIQNVKFEYVEALKPIVAKAENMIIDKIALDKDGSLSRYYDKFRYHTLDLVWSVENSLQDFVGIEQLSKQKAFSQMGGVSDNLTNLFAADLTLLTSTSGEIRNLRIKEGRISSSDNNPKVYLEAKTLLKSGDIFTLSFYNETYRNRLDSLKLSRIVTPTGGLTYLEAWMIMECRVVEIGTDGAIVAEVLSAWSR